jgi:hypothetical protein
LGTGPPSLVRISALPPGSESRLLRAESWLLLQQYLSAKTQPKVTDLNYPFWLAPMPLYVSQLRARLNFGSASIRLHLPSSGSFLMSSVTTLNRYGSRKRTFGVMINFTWTASSDGRMRLAGGKQRWPRTGIPVRTTNQDLRGTQK